MSIPTI